MRQTIEYTLDDDRSGVWSGTFQDVNEMNVGDYMLTHHTCKCCEKLVATKIFGKKLAYTFVDEDGKEHPQYDYITERGSSYKSNLKLTSVYDSRVAECDSVKKYPWLGK